MERFEGFVLGRESTRNYHLDSLETSSWVCGSEETDCPRLGLLDCLMSPRRGHRALQQQLLSHVDYLHWRQC